MELPVYLLLTRGWGLGKVASLASSVAVACALALPSLIPLEERKMTTPRSSLWRIVSLVLTLALFAVACGDSDDVSDGVDDDAEVITSTDSGANNDSAAAADPSDLEGEIFISGSSTVEPISVRVAELFEDVAPGVSVDVEGPGTGDGFKKFCAGETDISDASRQIKDAEAQDCAAAGIEYTEILVGIDGIGVMTSENNTAVECLTFDDLYGLIGPESDGVNSWADANNITATGLPDAPLTIFGPGEESGTYDSFIEIVLEDLAEERGQEASTRATYSPSADDNVILSGIQSSDTSLGWVGFAFAANAEGSKLLQVDGGDGCIEATPETIASNEYPISRNLYIYVNNAKAEASPALSGFVDFYTTTGLNEAVASVGYVELADTAKAEIASAWQG